MRSLLDKIKLNDDYLVRCFDRVLQQIPQEMRPALEGTITAKAETIRAWTAENQEILAAIRILNFSNANLNVLLPEIAYLTNLEVLSLENNWLISLPATFGQLHNLQWLHLANNWLTSLPASFGQLHNLRSLGIEGNQFSLLVVLLPFRIGGRTYGFEVNQFFALPCVFDLQYVGFNLRQWVSRSIQRTLSSVFSTISNRVVPSFHDLKF